MRRALTIAIVVTIAVVSLLFGLFMTFVYPPEVRLPKVTSPIAQGTIVVGGRTRSYLLYRPRGFKRGAPLVVAMHGSGESAGAMRVATGYSFERLAEQKGFAIVYPQGFEGYWNACNVVGDYAANALNIDDVGFLSAMADKLARDVGIDRTRVYAMGISRGGHMAIRLALEAPSHFRAVAAVAASVPAPGNFKCKPAAGGTSSVMIMNGTKDPLNPFEGGDAKLFGMFMARGPVLSSRESGAFFARLNAIAAAPATRREDVADGFAVEHTVWGGGSPVEVELVAIIGGGHAMPQPWRRGPRLLGPTAKDPNGAKVMWEFFARQKGSVTSAAGMQR